MEKQALLSRVFMFLVMAVLLGAWFMVYSQTYMAADTFWLAEAASRFLDGDKMAESYYDPNPPLSVLLYVPPALITKWGWLPIHFSAFYYTIALLAGTAFMLYRLLRAVPGSDVFTALLCTSAFIIANTTLTAITFTERDQILGMALCAFVVTQIFITKKWPLPRWLFHTSLLLGAVLVFLKPHHGLLPTLIILHRAITQKRISVWRDADFLYLAGCVIAYVILCLTYFSDYTFQILPDVLSLYTMTSSPHIVKYYAHYGLIMAGVLIAGYLLQGRKFSWPGSFFLACAVVAFIPYIAQMRGYHYHMLPAVMFFTMGLACTFKDVLSRFIAVRYAAPVALVITIILALQHYPLMRTFPTHQEYTEMPLSEIVRECPSPCSFFMVNDTMEITHQMAAYTNSFSASRFPSIWFQPAIMKLGGENKIDEANFLREKYGKMIAEDLARYKPQIAIIAEFYVTQHGKFNIGKLFANSSEFTQEWAKYRMREKFTVDQGEYFRGAAQGRTNLIVYQIYDRVE